MRASNATTTVFWLSALAMVGAGPTPSLFGAHAKGGSDSFSLASVYWLQKVPASIVVVAPDNSTLAVAGADGKISLLALGTGKTARSWRGHTANVIALAYAPNGTALASGSEDRTVRLWDTRTGKQLWKSGLEKTKATSLAFSPDGRTLAVAGDDQFIRFHESRTGKLLARMGDVDEFTRDNPSLLKGPVMRLAFSPDGQTLAAGCNRVAQLRYLPTFGRVHLWDLSTKKQVRRTEGTCSSLQAVAFSPDGRLLATASGGRGRGGYSSTTVELYLASNGAILPFMPDRYTDKLPVNAVLFSADGLLMLSGSDSGTIRLWEAYTGKEVCSILHLKGKVRGLTISPNGRMLVAALAEAGVIAWDLSKMAVKPRRGEVTKTTLARLWATLRSEDAQRAYRASWGLAALPAPATAFLKERLRPIPAVSPARLRRLVADLDDDDFERREAASAALGKLGSIPEAQLRTALARTKSPEQRRRIRDLLAPMPAAWPVKDKETLRSLRAIAVLQRIGTPAARAILAALAKGAPQAHQTQAARAALRSLPKPARR
jgi:WD40 repeat protein